MEEQIEQLREVVRSLEKKIERIREWIWYTYEEEIPPEVEESDDDLEDLNHEMSEKRLRLNPELQITKTTSFSSSERPKIIPPKPQVDITQTMVKAPRGAPTRVPHGQDKVDPSSNGIKKVAFRPTNFIGQKKQQQPRSDKDKVPLMEKTSQINGAIHKNGAPASNEEMSESLEEINPEFANGSEEYGNGYDEEKGDEQYYQEEFNEEGEDGSQEDEYWVRGIPENFLDVNMDEDESHRATTSATAASMHRRQQLSSSFRHGVGKRKRTSISPIQARMLKEYFDGGVQYLKKEILAEICSKTHLTPLYVSRWFANARGKANIKLYERKKPGSEGESPKPSASTPGGGGGARRGRPPSNFLSKEKGAQPQERLIGHMLEPQGQQPRGSRGGGKNPFRRNRTVLTPEQISYLIDSFGRNTNPVGEQVNEIARDTGLDRRVVQVWFQNRRRLDKRSDRTSVSSRRSSYSDSSFNNNYTEENGSINYYGNGDEYYDEGGEEEEEEGGGGGLGGFHHSILGSNY